MPGTIPEPPSPSWDPEGDHFQIHVNQEMDPFFDDSSIPLDGEPRLIVIVGAVAVGKTTLRKERFATGFVLVDAVPIFLSLCRGQYLDFPGPLEVPMQVMGALVTGQAIRERRNIVTEFIPDNAEQLKVLMDAMLAIGYRIELVYVDCPFEEAVKRNLNRDEDCISSYYAGKYQYEWLLEAAREAAGAPNEPSGC